MREKPHKAHFAKAKMGCEVVYRELMILGLISLGVKILKEVPGFNSEGKPMIGRFGHLLLIFLLLRNQNNRADRAELVATRVLVQAINSTDSEEMWPSFVQTLFCCATKKAIDKELVELRLLRRLFLWRFGLSLLFLLGRTIHVWILLLAVPWSVCGVHKLLDELDANTSSMPERQGLVEAFFHDSLDPSTAPHHVVSVLSFFRKVATTIGLTTKEKKKEIELKALNGVVAGSPELELRYEVWHVAVMFLLFLNGFLITLFVQCVVYDLDEIYEDFGTLAIFVGNTAIFQRHIFYDVGVVSYTVRIDSHVLSDVVQNFSYVIQLRSELGPSLLHQIMQRELSIIDSMAPGLLTLKSFVWLSRSLTRVRFNTVVKLLFELEGMTLAYSHVIRLVVMAQHEGHFASTSVCQHPLLRSDVFAHDNFDQARALSQPNYNLFDSTKELLPSSQPNMEGCSNVLVRFTKKVINYHTNTCTDLPLRMRTSMIKYPLISDAWL